MLPSAGVNTLKLCLHAAAGGSYGAVVLAIFLGVANSIGLRGNAALSLLPVIVVYTVVAGIIWPVLYGAVRFFARHPLRLSWMSLRYVMAFHVVNSAVVVAACWTTLSRSRRVFEPEVAARLEAFCLAVALAWLAAAVVSTIPRLRRVHWLQIASVGVALAVLFAPIHGRSDSITQSQAVGDARLRSTRSERRLVLLNFDGADLEDILRLEAQGKLPGFTKLREEGAYGRLQSLTPCLAPITRTTLITGKLPHRHGVRSGTERRMLGGEAAISVVPRGIGFDYLLAPLISRRNLSIADRRCLTLWEIASLRRKNALSAGWELDLDRSLSANAESRPSATSSVVGMEDLLDVDSAIASDPAAADRIHELARAIGADRSVTAILERDDAGESYGVVALSFPGLDRVAHDFLRYARPGDFGNVSEGEIDRYGRVLEGYYRRVDLIVDEVTKRWGETATLFVTSSHGIDPVPFARRLLSIARGWEGGSGTHREAPGGFLFARGPQIRPGHSFGRGSIADVVPTALYALGFPVARDLDGKIRTGLFTPEFTRRHAVAVIDTFEPAR